MIIIVESEFPRASELNPILYVRVCENILNNEEKIRYNDSLGGRRTGFNFHKQNVKEVDVLISWIKNILPDISKNFSTRTRETEVGYVVNAFEIAECWGVHYNKEESLVEHNHFPYALSFVYYVRTPKGSAPIIIENETYDIKEGQCIFFLASQFHSVDQNESDGRCAIVGNILYRF